MTDVDAKTVAIGLWRLASGAAELLEGIPHASICVGLSLPAEVCRELAALSRGKSYATLHIGGGVPSFVIESFEADHLGVQIRGQGSRPARPGDEQLRLLVSCGTDRRGTPEEAAAAIKASAPL